MTSGMISTCLVVNTRLHRLHLMTFGIFLTSVLCGHESQLIRYLGIRSP